MIRASTRAHPPVFGPVAALKTMIEEQFQRLRVRMDATVPVVVAALPPQAADRLLDEHGRWAASTNWESINAADPCGT